MSGKVGEKQSVPARAAPSYRPEPDPPRTPDLFARVNVIDAYTLGQRLLQLGADLYCEGEFATEKDRHRHAINREQFARVEVGRSPTGKGTEDFTACFERIYGEPLAPKKARAKP